MGFLKVSYPRIHCFPNLPSGKCGNSSRSATRLDHGYTVFRWDSVGYTVCNERWIFVEVVVISNCVHKRNQQASRETTNLKGIRRGQLKIFAS